MSNTTAIEVFTFPVTNDTVRTITDEKGEPWFAATDVCKTLGLYLRWHKGGVEVNTWILKKYIGQDNTILIPHNQAVGNTLLMINESALYKLIMRSDKPEAKKFQDWVTGTVLPAIRKDGAYVVGEEKMLTGEMSEDELLLKAMTILTKKVERLTAERDALQAENQTMLPKAKLYDQYMDVDGTLNLTSAAKVLGFTSGRALGMYLRETLGWLFKDTKQVIPKAYVIEKGFMTTKAWSMIDRQKSGVQGRITAKGMD